MRLFKNLDSFVEENKKNEIISMIETISDYISFLSKDDDMHIKFYFKRVYDVLYYELYFPNEIKNGGSDISKYLNDLPALKDDEQENTRFLKNLYKQLSNPKHPINTAFLKILTIDEINQIEGRFNGTLSVSDISRIKKFNSFKKKNSI